MRQRYEYAVVGVEVRLEERVRPVVVGQGAANICAGPTEHRGRRGLDGEISRMRSERTKQHRGARHIFEKTLH